MKNNFFKQLLKLTATAVACAAFLIIGNPTTTPPEAGGSSNVQTTEEPDTREDHDKEPGISPMNNKEEEVKIMYTNFPA